MKKLFRLLVLLLCISTAYSQELEQGKIYVIYGENVSKTPEEKNNYSFFYVVSKNQKGITITEAIFDEERKAFFIGLDLIHNIRIKEFKENMTIPILPVKVEDGYVLMPKYK